MRLIGLHHVTAICRDMGRTIAFYRDLLGLSVVFDGPSDDDPEARHVAFTADDQRPPRPGTVLTFLEYPGMPEGSVGLGSTHHFALTVGSEEEQLAWRDYLRAHGVQCTDVYDRTFCRALYLRDPDGHVVEIATIGPGFPPPSAATTSSAPAATNDEPQA